MRVIVKLNKSSNLLGSFSSGLCLIHCIATPFLFAGLLGHIEGNHSYAFRWGVLDLIFIALQFNSLN